MICDIRLATTEAGLSKGYLIFSWGLPEPNLALYNDHAQQVNQAGGGQSLRGYRRISLTFTRLTAKQVRTLTKLAEDALDAGGLIYATADRSWGGRGGLNDWIDVTGVPHLPNAAPAPNTHGLAFANVTLFLNNVTVLNDPASF